MLNHRTKSAIVSIARFNYRRVRGLAALLYGPMESKDRPAKWR